jgi:hypothetical protein
VRSGEVGTKRPPHDISGTIEDNDDGAPQKVTGNRHKISQADSDTLTDPDSGRSDANPIASNNQWKVRKPDSTFVVYTTESDLPVLIEHIP